MARFTDELRAKAGDQWNRVVHHKFNKELAAGTIDKQTILKRYLVQDHRFLDSGVVLVASMVAKLSNLEDRIPGCQWLAVLTGKENTYFERSFEVLGVTECERSNIPDADVKTKFCKLLTDVAESGNLEEMLAVIVACEWTYLSWAQAVLSEEQEEVGPKIDRENFETFEWIELHSGPGFEGFVDYLRKLLDRQGEQLKADNCQERLEACERRFLEAVDFEEQFFDYTYQQD
jgi:thiaminase/transcriptional activator TenA